MTKMSVCGGWIYYTLITILIKYYNHTQILHNTCTVTGILICNIVNIVEQSS